MLVVTVTVGADVPGPPRDLVQRLNNRPTPDIACLLARHWHVDRRRVQGRYLFEDETAGFAFAHQPTDSTAEHDLRMSVPVGTPMTTTVDRIDPRAHALDRPIFVVSAPRSGSTLLTETLSLAEGLWSLDSEGQAVIEGLRSLHPATTGYESHRLTQDDVTDGVAPAVVTGYLSSLRRRHLGHWSGEPTHPRMLDKTPENALRIPFLHALFPDARFVLMHRESRPNIASIVAAWHHPGFTNIADLPGWSRQRWCFLLPRGWRSYNAAPISDVAAFQWRSANVQAMDDLNALPRCSWCTVGYEELVARPGPTIRRLCDDLELEVGSKLEARLAQELPLSATTITVPSPTKWRSDPRVLESSFARLGHVGGRLRALEAGNAALAAPAQPADPPQEWFACWIADLPLDTNLPRSWIVNPTLRVQLGTSPPTGLANRVRFRDRFLPDHPVLWVENPVTGALDPYWARQVDAWWARMLQPGRPLPVDLGDELPRRLRTAEVLIDSDGAVENASQETWLATAKAGLVVDRYAVLPELLRPEQRLSYTAYYQRLIGSGKWTVGDGQVSRRYGWHNEPMARFLHHQLTTLVSRVAGEPVKPAYCYSSAYCGGAALDAHTDRAQCEFTLSMLLEESSGPEVARWPLWFASPTGRAQVLLRPGEAVLFRGCELPHWREAAPPEHEQTMLLFHYVPAGFVGPRS